MKKLLTALLTILTISLMLMSCSTKPKSPEEVLNASIKALEETKSFRLEMTIDQALIYGPNGEPQKQTAEIVTDYVKKPEGLHLKTNMNVAGPQVDAEMYYAEGEVYTTSSRWEHWYKGKEDGYQPSLDTTKRMVNLSDRLKWLKVHSKEMKMKEEEDHLALSFTGEGEEFESFTNYSLDLSKPALYDSKYLKDVKTNELTYTIFLEKESFLPTETTINLDIEMLNELDGNEMKTTQTIKENYTKMNKIETITIPSEVKDTAKDKF